MHKHFTSKSIIKNFKKVCSICFLFLVTNGALGQGLPRDIQLSPDGRMILSGKQASHGGFFDSSKISRLDFTFAEANWKTILALNYASKTNLKAQLDIDGVRYQDVGIRYKGNTSYRAVLGDKKSFNVTLDFSDTLQEIGNYSSFNLNNQHGDVSFLREVFYLHQIRNHIPAAKGNFINLFINGESWGIYGNIQQVSRSMMKEWFKNNDGALWRADPSLENATTTPLGGGSQWGNGTTGMNYLGTDLAKYQQYYDLRFSKIADPWEKLREVTDKLNNTPTASLPQVVPLFIDVDKTLWYLASEIAFGDDDSYVFKGRMDYFTYYDEATKTFVPLEYDGNSSQNNTTSTWSPFYNADKVNYPLLNKLLQVPEYRQRYLAHMRTINETLINPTKSHPILTNYYNQIKALVYADPKKNMTNVAFDAGQTTLKNWLNSRYLFLKNNSEMNVAPPSINNVVMSNPNGVWKEPNSTDEVTITAKVGHSNGVTPFLHYGNTLFGSFNKLLMYDDGKHNDGLASDGVFGVSLPAQSVDSWIRFYIEAVANNTAKTVAYEPVGAEHDVFVYHVAASASQAKTVVINEFMASNTVTVKNEIGKYEDWIEIYNTTTTPINLDGYYITDNPLNLNKWKFKPNTVIPARGYFMLWADEDGKIDSTSHTNFKLSKDGESVILLDKNLTIIDSVTFGAQKSDLSYARIPNGTGDFKITRATFNGSNDGLVNSIELAADTNLKIYPNPAANIVYLESHASQNSPVRIYNSIGVLVHNMTFKGKASIDINGWTPGLYLIKTGNDVYKLIVR